MTNFCRKCPSAITICSAVLDRCNIKTERQQCGSENIKGSWLTLQWGEVDLGWQRDAVRWSLKQRNGCQGMGSLAEDVRSSGGVMQQKNL